MIVKVDRELLYKSLGDAIRSERKRQNKSQEALARMVGVKRSMISHIETGKKQSPLFLLYAVAEALRIEINLLLPQQSFYVKRLTESQTPHGIIRLVSPETEDALQDYYGKEIQRDE